MSELICIEFSTCYYLEQELLSIRKTQFMTFPGSARTLASAQLYFIGCREKQYSRDMQRSVKRHQASQGLTSVVSSIKQAAEAKQHSQNVHPAPSEAAEARSVLRMSWAHPAVSQAARGRGILRISRAHPALSQATEARGILRMSRAHPALSQATEARGILRMFRAQPAHHTHCRS